MSSSISLQSLMSALSTSSSSSSSGSGSSGYDVSTIVSGLVYAARAPERVWQSQQDTIDSVTSELTGLQTSVQTLLDKIKVLSSATGAIASRTADSSNSSVLTASAAAGTTAGSHLVTVSNLASTSSWYSSVVSSSSATLSPGSITLQVGSGTAKTFTINSSTNSTLTALAKSINDASMGVTASVVSDANGARLTFVSNTTGAPGDITLTSTPLDYTSANVATSSSATLDPGSVTLTLADGSTQSFTINSTTNKTLDDLAASINSASLGVTATVVTDSNGAHIQVADSTTGDTTGLSLKSSALSYTRASQGVNANLTVDGIPISSASNTVSGSIAGLTLKLTGTTTSNSPVTVTVSEDTNGVTTALNDFVTSYNSIISGLNKEFAYTEGGTAMPLQTDSTARIVFEDLLGSMSFSSKSSSKIQTLSDLGIRMGNDGTLSVDSSKMADVVSNNFSDVQAFLQTTNGVTGFANKFSDQLSALTNSTDGAFTVELKSLATDKQSLQDHIDNFEIYIESMQTQWTNTYNNLNVLLATFQTTQEQVKAQLDSIVSSNG